MDFIRWVLVGLTFLTLLLLSSTAIAKCQDKPIRIGIVDTGFGYNGHGKGAKLCPTGHKDFSGENEFTTEFSVPVPSDSVSHGTNIAGIIEKYAKKAHVNYCLVIVKFYQSHGYGNAKATVEAFNYLADLKVDFVNYSAGGVDPNLKEEEAVERILNGGAVFVAAAGNESLDLDNPKNGYYPAQYDKRIIVVGSLYDNGHKLPSSNYGSIVNRWEPGLLQVGYDISMSGTSQAAATATGKLVSESKNKCYR